MEMINHKNARMWSLLGPSGTFGSALAELAKGNDKIVVLTGDMTKTAGLERFRKSFPDRLVNVGIAEQNMVGMAAGFASGSFVPFVVSFANFSVLRACETVRHFLGYMGRNVKLVGVGAGFSTGMFGPTHYGTEDVSIARTIPGITILSPADCTELVKALEATVNTDGPVYLRLTGVMNNPVVYNEDFDFEIGKAITLKQGTDVAIVATGDMHTICPLDTTVINRELNSSKLIVSVEEHGTVGGLGGAIAEHMSSIRHNAVLLRLGIEDKFKDAGSYRFMLEQNELLPEQLAHNIRRKYESLK